MEAGSNPRDGLFGAWISIYLLTAWVRLGADKLRRHPKDLLGGGEGQCMANWEEQFGIFLIPDFYRPRNPPTPNPPPDVWWERSVRVDLETINRTRVGRALLRAIKFHGVAVSILKRGPGDRDDHTFPIDDDLGTGNPKLQITMGPTIAYAPEQHDLGNLCERTRHGGLGQIWIQGHEVLLHELVHAFRLVSFKRPVNYSRTTKGFAFYDDPEELYAVLVQGIYASERNNPVRSSHTGHFPIDRQLDGSLEFYKTGTESFDLVGRFCTENPGFTREIAHIDTHFNPIRAYYFTPAAAKQMAQSKFAKARDQAEPLFNDAYHWLLNQFNNRF